MNLLARFSQIFTNTPATSNPIQRFDCPNCWGTQQWDGIEQPGNIDLRKDTTSIGRARQGFIQRFAERYLRHPLRRS